ncbi:TetR/AcrR family transcriptional regulator [Streptomyces sp. 049-1]|uniref:TetR/AcrR family transcriptional regulator n=1 Tax=Streptomyces sp. 049-1 TaxID=2789264 RepID=UPI003980D1FF
MPDQTSHKPPSLRADARHNRERLLEAAREVFAAQGVDAPMNAVARRAGVGVATLYRRFPTRSALVSAAFTEQLSVCAAAFEEALADPDPGHGLYTLLEQVCTTLVTDRGFDTVFMAGFPESLDHAEERACAEERLSQLIERARAAGQLREDFDPADIPLLLMAVNGLAGQPPEVALPGARRLLTYLFQAFQAHPPSRPGPLPPAPAAPLPPWDYPARCRGSQLLD